MRELATEWFGLAALDDLEKDSTVFTEISPDVGPSAREETLRVVTHVFESDLDARDLMTTRDTFVNRKLASLASDDGRAGCVMGVALALILLFGLGMASMFANMLGMSEPLVPSTGTVTSLYLVGSSLGGIVVTGSMGALLDRYGAVALPVVAAIGTLATLAIVVALELSARRRGPLRSS